MKQIISRQPLAKNGVGELPFFVNVRIGIWKEGWAVPQLKDARNEYAR
jgi:hypothetical protein